jgi:prepilin-type N-terminal cleavage/methylation domain-containing protein
VIRPRGRAGFTLVELLVVMAILAACFAVVAAELLTASAADPRDPWETRLDSACARAIEAGVATVAWPDSAHVVAPVLFLPDGRVGSAARAEVGSC